MTSGDFDLLIHRYFEGTLSSEEEQVFWQRIKTDPSAADRFVEMSELESAVVESLKADEEMPSGVYAAVHGMRRRTRMFPAPTPRPVWPYWVAAALFIAALSLLLRTESSRDLPGPVVRETPIPKQEPVRETPTPPRSTLVAERDRRQELLQELQQKRDDLFVARKAAEEKKEEQTKRDLDKDLAVIEARRQEEETKLAKVEDLLKQSTQTRPSTPPPPAAALLETVEGEVAWIAGKAAKAGESVPAGAGLLTAGAKSRVVVKLLDETRFEIRGEGRLEDIQGDQKRLTLRKGTLLAAVAKQTGPRSVVITTPHAELSVLGTKFLVQVGADDTRLDVEEGKVRNTRLTDKKFVEVSAGNTVTTTAKTGPLTSRPLPVVRSFQDGVAPTPDYAGTQDTSIGSTSTAAAGSQDLLRVYRDAGREVQNTALLRWDISSIPPKSRVISAELGLWVTGVQANTGTARAFELRRPWEESEATWKFARAGAPWQMAGARGDGDMGARVLAQIAPAAPGWSTFSLNDAGVLLVQQWVNAPATNFGIGVTKEPANAWDLNSREWATPHHRPKLTVTYLPPAK